MDNTNAFPKVLIVTNCSIHDKSQTAITLKNIWGLWPTDSVKYFIVGMHSCDKFINTNDEYVISKFSQPLATIFNTKVVKKVNNGIKISSSQNNDQNVNVGIIKKIIKYIRQYIYSLVDRSPIYIFHKDYIMLDKYSPDVIYTLGSSVTLLKISVMLSKHFGKPILMHFMDNWPEIIQWADNFLLIGYQKSLKKWLNKAYNLSMCALTISEKMAIDYEKRTHIKHFPIMNSVDLDKWRCEKKVPNDIFSFVYAGGLHLGRDKTIIEIYNSLSKISYYLNKKCELIVYTNNVELCEKIVKNDNCTLIIKKAVPQDELKDIYRNADVLIIAESLYSNNVFDLFAKYSISTKTAEYLATNRVILYVGSKSRTLYYYLKENNAAIVVDKLSFIDKAIGDHISYFDEIINNAYALAKKNHDINSINEKLKNAIVYRKI